MNNLLNGHIQKRRVRCGKDNCRCATGEKHTAFYHVWREAGKRFQIYVRKSEIEMIKTACRNNRILQTKLRKGRAEYKRNLKLMRQMLGEIF
jgi:hypothetical protein